MIRQRWFDKQIAQGAFTDSESSWLVPWTVTLALPNPHATRILVGTSIEKEIAELWAFGWQLAAAGGLAGGR